MFLVMIYIDIRCSYSKGNVANEFDLDKYAEVAASDMLQAA